MRVLRDLSAAWKRVRREPRFVVGAVLVLAIGIGLATAVFTVADALLVRRLPVVDQDRVVLLWGRKVDGSFDNFPFSLDDARLFTRSTRTLQHAGYFAYEGATPITIRRNDETARLHRASVSGSFFDVLGARPLLGRALQVDDDAAGAEPVVVLSYLGWQRVFASDPDVVGKSFVVHQDGRRYTIVGVMPRGLDYPRGVDAWTTIYAATPQRVLQYVSVDLIGRLARGSDLAAARTEVTAHFQRPDASMWQRGVEGVANTLPRVMLGDAGTAVLVFAAAAGVLLFITCINVANLVLVRGLGRAREFAVRAALGASRGRLAALLLSESAVLAGLGGALGLVLSAAAIRVFVALAPADLPRVDEISLNTTALLAAAFLTLIALALFAGLPAYTTSRAEAQDALRSGGRHGASRQLRLTSELLVGGQVALAFVIVAAAGMLAKSFLRLQRADLAFDPSRLLIAELALNADRYNAVAKQQAMLDELLPQLRALPGVRAIAPVVAVPFAGGWAGRPVKDGQSDAEAAANPMLNMELVTPDYFRMFGIPLVRGRDFTADDRKGALQVVIVSESAAQRYFPREEALGKRLRIGGPTDPMATIVGIVPDTRYRDLREARASIYFPLAQSIFPFAPTTLVIRTEFQPRDMIPAVRQRIESGPSGLALAGAATFDDFLATPLAQPRLNAWLLLLFGAAASLLAAVGLFGVMMLTVRQRTRELGVRMALGATAARVGGMVMARSLTIALGGLAAGALAAVAVNRALAALLYSVSPSDPAVLAASAGISVTIALIVALVPARLGARSNPILALKSDDA